MQLMMDPVTAIGLVASVGQLIAATANLIRYMNDVKEAPRDQARLALECANLVAFLTEFRYAIDDLDLKDPHLTSIQLLAGKNGALEQLAEAVNALYERLRPGRRAGRFVKAVIWPLQKQDVDGILSRIERLKSLITLHRQGDHFRLSLQTYDDVVELKSEVEKDRKDRERQEILEWISDLDFSKKQAYYLARSQSGTGEWFLKGDIFNGWIDGPPRTLWCHGQPGAGKTILTSLVINHLELRSGSRSAIVYVYFNYKEQETQTADNLIASVLRQFVQAGGDIGDDVTSTHNRHSKKGSRPTSKEWSSLLHAQVQRFSRTFIVVDALDECSENGVRDSFLAEIRQLQSAVHILVTSRFPPSIETELSESLQTEIRASDGDVKQYLTTRIQNEGRLVRLLGGNAELQATVVENIAINANGMFLLAQLQMDSVAKKNNRRDVHRSLASFPQKLNDTYDEVMRRISSQSQEDIDLAERLLEWVVCAKRPLKLIEVQHALAVEEGDVDLDEDGIPDEDLMVFACAGLVTVDLDSTVRLVHRTAQEYFEQILAARFPRAQINITSTCLTYLSFDAMYAENCPGNELKDQLERYPLTAYAVQWWGEHARGEPEVPLKESIISFLKNDSKVVVWYRISNYLRRAYDSPLPSLSQVVGLHIAARFGLSRVVGSLISASDVNARDSSGETPLHWAARYGQETVVKELLNQPSCIADAISHRGRTPLSFAAANGHAGVVSLLLQRQDVDADAKDPFFGESPLWKAVDQGHEAVVRLLLGHPNVDVNCQNIPWGQTPLWRATDNVHTAIVSLLLQRADVDVNANDSIYAQTPLQRATADGNVAIVELLLRHPVIDVIAADRPGGQLNMTIRLSSLDHPALSCS